MQPFNFTIASVLKLLRYHEGKKKKSSSRLASKIEVYESNTSRVKNILFEVMHGLLCTFLFSFKLYVIIN